MPTSIDGSFPAKFALELIQLVGRWNIGASELVTPLGLSPAALALPGARVSLEDSIRLMSRARSLTGEDGLGIYLGMQLKITLYGYLGFAMMTSLTLRSATELAILYAPTQTSMLALQLKIDGGRASMEIEERSPLGPLRDVALLWLVVGLWKVSESLTQQPLRGDAEFTFPEPAYIDRFRDLFPGRLRFSRPLNRITYDVAFLDLPIVSHDPAASELARAQCEGELRALIAREQHASRLEQLLRAKDGELPTIKEAARALQLSERSLKRRLAAEATSFSKLVDRERHRRAIHLVTLPSLSLESLAEQVGYADVSNFTRAFRRWTGLTPSAFRKAKTK